MVYKQVIVMLMNKIYFGKLLVLKTQDKLGILISKYVYGDYGCSGNTVNHLLRPSN